MVIRGKDVVLSLLTVGAAAVAGYLFQSGRAPRASGREKADIGARIVEEVPADATVVDVSSRRLQEIPAAYTAIDRALEHDASEEWKNVTLERDDAWDVVDALRGSMPYYHADGTGYNGVYVRCGERVVVIDAIGWARLEKRLY